MFRYQLNSCMKIVVRMLPYPTSGELIKT